MILAPYRQTLRLFANVSNEHQNETELGIQVIVSAGKHGCRCQSGEVPHKLLLICRLFRNITNKIKMISREQAPI